MTLYIKKDSDYVYLVERDGKVVSLFLEEKYLREWCRDNGVKVRKYGKEKGK